MTATDLPPTAEDEPALLDWLAAMRDEQPVWRDGTGIWHVFRHDDVEADPARPGDVLLRHRPDLPARPRPVQRGMLTAIDPPEHRALRRLVSAAFTPQHGRGARAADPVADPASCSTPRASASTWSTRWPSRCR